MKEKSGQWTYRFTMDDCIIFLQDLARKEYSSLFDQPFLAFWKEMHDKYQVKIQFNIHEKRGKFSIGQLSDIYKPEWIKNSDWIRLVFHQAEDPKSSFSYKDSSHKEVKEDYLRLSDEIIRFAGKELLTPFITIHHGVLAKDGARALREYGVRGLGGGTWREHGKLAYNNYYLDHTQTIELDRKGVLREPELGLYFTKFDVCLHQGYLTKEELVKMTQSVLSSLNHWHHIEVAFEEWSFDPQDKDFLSDAKERVKSILSFLLSSQVKSVFLEEIL